MRGRGRLLVAVFVVAAAAAPALAQQQDVDQPWRHWAEVRMFCPSDIDRYYAELSGVPAPEGKYPAYVEEVLDELWALPEEATPRQAEQYERMRRDHLAVLAEHYFEFRTPMTEAEAMRRVAYGMLHDWPAAKRGLAGPARGWFHGENLLRRVWPEWKRARQLLMKRHIRSDPQVRDRFARAWGADPQAVPLPAPRDFASPAVDCRWYLSIRYEASGSSESTKSEFVAALFHQGSLLGTWDSSNTQVISHYQRSGGPAGQAPQLTEMRFRFPLGERAPIFTTDRYANRAITDAWASFWISLGAWNTYPEAISKYADWEHGTGLGIALQYPFDIDGQLTWADAYLEPEISPRFGRFEEHVRLLLERKGNGLHEGERLRKWAGPYRSAGELQR